MTGRHVFITGVSAGIGAAVARAAAAAGDRISGCARSQAALGHLSTELTAGSCLRVADVTDPKALQAAMTDAVNAFGKIDILVANAGKGCNGRLSQMDASRLRGVFELNLIGLHQTIQTALPQLSAGACIQVVSSLVAWLPVPLMGAYCASKHAVQAYAETLRMELHDQGYDVVTVSPGTVDTGFFATANREPGEQWSYRPGKPLPVDRLARSMIGQWQRRQRVLVLPRRARFIALASALVPGLMQWWLRRQLT